MKKELVVLSLCDGISCGRLALDKAGIPVKKYFASEINDNAIKVTTDNYPDTVQIGDVRNVSYTNGILRTENGDYKTIIDLVIFGSPCQTLSIAMKPGLRVGLENSEKSGLFWHCYRVLKEVNPKFFLMENVARMRKEDVNTITSKLKVRPIKLNSALVSAQHRERLYWSNIDIPLPPEDRGVMLQSVLTNGYSDRTKSRALLASDSRPLKDKKKMLRRYFGTGFTTIVWDKKGDDTSVRYFNQTELERLQTVPEGYTKCLSRNQAANVLGNAWTVDIIAHLFSGLKKEIVKNG